MTIWTGKTHPDSLLPLEDFANDYLRDKDHHSDVKTEDLVEHFRAFCNLPPFPTLDDLRNVCERLGIALGKLETKIPGMSAANTSSGTRHSIYVRDDVSVAHAESSIGHELREIIENAFRHVKPGYEGLDTHDNAVMNPRSDYFAGCLLMQRDVSRAMIESLGYDFVAFADRVGRSLSSVVVRAQELYSASQPIGIVGGVWLFQLPWTGAPAQVVPATGMKLAHKAHLSGFSIQSPKRGRQRPHAMYFPRKGSTVADFDITLRAFRSRASVVALVEEFDLFPERNYLVAAEPIVSGGVPWRVVMTAVRNDFVEQVEPWTTRLGVPWEGGANQSA
jgi:IrrE N-terminal-like domain